MKNVDNKSCEGLRLRVKTVLVQNFKKPTGRTPHSSQLFMNRVQTISSIQGTQITVRSVFKNRFTMNNIPPKLLKCWTHKIAFKIISKTLKQSNVFYSQPSIQEALAKFYLSTWTVESGGCTPPPQFLPNFCKISLYCSKFWHFYAYSPNPLAFQLAPGLSNSLPRLCYTTFGLSFM